MDKAKRVRVGTLTFHKSLNYGSFLQAYALQQKLLQMGVDTELIDFEPAGFKKLYSDFLVPTNLWSLSYDYIHFRLWKFVRDRRECFQKSAQRLLRVSERKYDSETGLEAVSEQYDVVICGSDQIWNANAHDFDLNYMLADVQGVKKASYAVSINKGKYDSAPERTRIHQCIENFDHLSVREENGKEYLDAFLDGHKQVRVMIDPTFLLTSKDYDHLLSGEPRITEPYIFLFSIHFKEPVRKVAKKLSERTGLPVYTLFSGRGTKNSLKANKEFHMLSGDVGPESFIDLIKHAAYVVADSFHGTAFSIIYRKQFVSVYDQQRDIRIGHILSLLGLSRRYIQPSEMDDYDISGPVDYSAAEAVLEERVAEAERFLDEILGDSV